MWSDVSAFTQAAATSKSMDELSDIFGRMVQSWGFSNFLAIQVSSRQSEIRAPLAKKFGQPPVLWLDRYREAGHIRRDAGIARIMSSTDPYWWSELKQGELSREEQLVFGEAAEFGLSRALVVPVRLPDGSIWSCSLSSEFVDECDEVKFAAAVAANYFVGRGVYLQSSEADPFPLAYNLTKRQREIVYWLSRGLTANEIGMVLNISGKTVLHQLNDAKRRLNARTLASLVAEAAVTGEIKLRD